MSAHNILQQLFLEAAPYKPADPGDAGALTNDRQFAYWSITTAAGETRTLAQPTRPALRCVVALDVDGGDLTLTVTGGFNPFGNTSLTFADAGDWVEFYSVEVGTSYYWRVAASNGVDVGSPMSTNPMWDNCPSPANPAYKSLVHEYFNDFRALSADYDATNEWTLTEDDAACAQALSADAVSGELLLTNKATTDDNAQQINLQQESFKFATGKKLWFETRFKTAAGATQIDWASGLIEAEDLTGVADNMPANGVVFHKEDGDTNIDIASSDNGTNLASAAVGTWDTSYHTLGFYFDGGATGSATITPYIDGVAGTAISSVTYATMAELAPLFMVRNGDATTTQTMTIDYVRVVQLR